jgi:hypothetical protein
MRPVFRALVSIVLLQASAFAQGYNLPERVSVMPVAFVPADQKVLATVEQNLFLKHLAWTRKRYEELLVGDSFDLAQEKMEIVRGAKPLDYYRNRPENGAPDITAEILQHFKVTRFENPYVFSILLTNPGDGWPAGGGRTINGGLNSGGGMMFISSHALKNNQHFQTTLQHELGHAFGLPHPDVYGYDLKANPSIMSYSPANYTDGFKPSRTPGVLIPEDLRALALNDRAFPKTTFDPARDVPAVYQLSPRIVPLGPMTLTGMPDFYPQVTTDAGEAVRSKVVNVVQGEIKPSAGPGITYDPRNMWHSEKLPDGRSATLTFTFPFPVELTGLGIHSQHSALDHAVTHVTLETADPKNVREVVSQPVTEIDAVVTFPKAIESRWRLRLKPGQSGFIVVRGLRFLNGDREVVPHMVPYAQPALGESGRAR